MTDQQQKILEDSINHIIESGANTIRIVNAFKDFLRIYKPVYSEIEVFNIEATEKGNLAHISYRELNANPDTNGYNHLIVPFNLRPIQKSSRDNYLVNQTVKNYETESGS